MLDQGPSLTILERDATGQLGTKDFIFGFQESNLLGKFLPRQRRQQGQKRVYNIDHRKLEMACESGNNRGGDIFVPRSNDEGTRDFFGHKTNRVTADGILTSDPIRIVTIVSISHQECS